MAERLSGWKRFKLWLEDLKIARELRTLRQSGALQRILDESPYTYLPPGSFQGDGWYHIHPKGSDRMDEFAHSCLCENRALWWIVKHHRQSPPTRSNFSPVKHQSPQ